MSELVTDPDDPRLGHGVDTEPTEQHDAYLVLSAEERARGFVKPYRDSYKHVGAPPPRHPLRDLTVDEIKDYEGSGYVKYEEYPKSKFSSIIGVFWTQAKLDAVGKGCGAVTTMGTAIAETYARKPNFYGSTYCCGCKKHLPLKEFRWEPDGENMDPAYQ